MTKSNVFYFNPTCELAVANGSFSYMPPLLLQKMESDLAMLPFIFATENDFVLTENPPSADFIQRLKDAGFDVPRFCRLTELEACPDGTFDTISPWGWSPAAHFKLKTLKEKCSDSFKSSPVFNWNENAKFLFERATSLDFLIGLLDQNPFQWFIDRSMAGVVVTSIDEIESILSKKQELILKAPLSSSGRGIQFIRNGILNNANKQWTAGVLMQQKYLIAEPLLEKLADFSFQFQISSECEIEYLGSSFFETSSNGQYQGSFIHHELSDFLAIEKSEELQSRINQTANTIKKALKLSDYAKWHHGFLGVDAMVIRNGGRILLQPCVEINCRANMGILTLMLENKINREAKGKFELFYRSAGEFNIFSMDKTSKNPLVFRKGKLISGFLPLVEPDNQQKFGAYFSLGSAK
ncbi:MAG: hypothetical protein JZU47_16285 [Prolixibacteraceae bacterium]|nr:hypothetical protein [Prolixibacteraceae bacterium]